MRRLLVACFLVLVLASTCVLANYYDDSEDHHVPTDERGSIRPTQTKANTNTDTSNDKTEESASESSTEGDTEQEKEKDEEEEEEDEEPKRKSNTFDDDEDEGEEAESIPRSRPAQPSAPVDDDPEIVLPKISYYELLKVDFDPEPEALKRAYRTAALANHPDKFRDPLEKRRASKLFVRIVNAFEVLSKPAVRRRYNDLLRAGIFDYDYHAWLNLMGQRDSRDSGGSGSADDVFFRNFEDADRQWSDEFDSGFNDASAGMALAIGAVSMLAFLGIPGYIFYEKSTRKKREIENLTKRVKAVTSSSSSSSSSLPARSPSSNNTSLQNNNNKTTAALRASPTNTLTKEPSAQPTQYVSSFSTGPAKSDKKDEKGSEHIAWSLDEMSLLAKAMQKHPGGTRDRWTVITDFFNSTTKLGVKRTQKEITNKAKELHPDHAITSVSATTAASSSLGAEIASRS